MVQHCTPELLALAALHEPLPSDAATHLTECGACRGELAGLRRGVELLTVPEFAAPGEHVPPPPSVWASIAAATGVASSARPERVAAGTDHAREPGPVAAPGAATEVTAPDTEWITAPVTAPVTAEPVADGAGASAAVVPLRPRRSRPWLLAAAAAVVGAMVGGGTVAALQGGDDVGAPVAAAALDPLADSDASGTARVVERADGTRLLEVELRAPELDGAYYEVWLLEPDVSGLVPMGTTQAGTARFEIPAGLDLGRFPVVDVSVEPLDGDPAHSGDSVVRGVLDA